MRSPCSRSTRWIPSGGTSARRRCFSGAPFFGSGTLPEGGGPSRDGVATAGATNSFSCYSVGAASDIDGDKTNGEVILVRLALDGKTAATQPGNVKTVFPGADGSCLDATGKTPVYGAPCTMTGPDVF